jgi:DNA-directed RNA polymerase II subunit RPB1
MSLIQDSLVAAYLMTSQPALVDRATMMQLLSSIGSWELPPPAVLKPQALWTGHQVFSAALPRALSMRMGKGVREGLLIREGELLQGQLGKAALGPSTGGLLQVIAKMFSATEALRFMERCQTICSAWLGTQGFSVGIGDCLLPEPWQKQIGEALSGWMQHVQDMDAQGARLGIDPERREQITKNALLKALAICGEAVQASQPNNALAHMVAAKSKGSIVNLCQIGACVGQQVVEGRRVGYDESGARPLSWFPDNCTDPAARGFVRNGYATGLDPAAVYFHGSSGVQKASRRVAMPNNHVFCIQKLEECCVNRSENSIKLWAGDSQGMHVTSLCHDMNQHTGRLDGQFPHTL